MSGKRVAPIQCPWCGRQVSVSRLGVLPRHKRTTGIDLYTGAVLRDWCDGGCELPYALSGEQRAYLRTTWLDEAGQPMGDAS